MKLIIIFCYFSGMHYHVWDWPRTIEIIRNYYEWDKVSLMAHSMGSIASIRYSVMFPEQVDICIAVENLITEKFEAKYLLESLPSRIKKLEIEQKRLDKEPPAYPYDEAVKILHKGSGNSIDIDKTHYLLKRGTKPSKSDPNKFYFCRDSRLKHVLFVPEDKEFLWYFSEKMTSPLLYIKASESPYAADEFSVGIRDMILKNNNKAEMHYLNGTHHVHLNNPESIAPLIISFLKKHGVLQNDAQMLKVKNML